MALLRSFVWVGRLARCTDTVVRSASGGGGEGERVKGANYFNEGEDPVLKADTEVRDYIQTHLPSVHVGLDGECACGLAVGLLWPIEQPCNMRCARLPICTCFDRRLLKACV